MRRSRDFCLQTCQIAKSSGFKSGECSGRNSAKNCLVVLAVWTGAKSARIRPLETMDHMLAQNLLVDVIVETSAGVNWLAAV